MELTKLISCETLSEHEVLPLLGEFCNQNSTQLTCWNLGTFYQRVYVKLRPVIWTIISMIDSKNFLCKNTNFPSSSSPPIKTINAECQSADFFHTEMSPFVALHLRGYLPLVQKTRKITGILQNNKK